MPCEHTNEENCLFINACNQKPLQQGQEIHLPSVDHNKFLPLFELPHCDHHGKKIKTKVLKGHEFVHVKHETSNFL
jgi:hypothetical protein